MAAERKALWRVAAALLLLVTVPLYGSLPPLPPPAPEPELVSADVLEDLLEPASVQVLVLAIWWIQAPGSSPALGRPGAKTRVWASDLSPAAQRQGNHCFRSEIASCDCIQAYAFTLGPAGNRTAITEHDGTIRSYGYDALYRLTGETVTDGGGNQVYSKTFGYDPVGNRLQQATTGVGAGTVAYTYDDRDRLLDEGGQAYSWDQNGNLTAKTEEAAYAWDFEDRLETVTLDDGTVVTHTYDADGVRVRTETTPPGEETQVVDYLVDTSGPLSQVVAESTVEPGTGAVLLTAYYVRGDDLLSVMRPDGDGWASRFYHADGLGSIRALTDETGVVTDRYTFTAFGELLEHTGDDPNAYLFAGEMLDPNSGFYYNRARWMDPGVGRFVSVDPFPGLQRDQASLHRYLYTFNDPVNLLDPSGLIPDWLVRVMVGSAVHAALSKRFRAATLLKGHLPFTDQGITTILGIDRGSCLLTGRFESCLVRPDLVDATSGEVYEIKTVKQERLGQLELAGYLALLNLNSAPGRVWIPGTTFESAATLLLPTPVGTWEVRVNPARNGVITYTARDFSFRVKMVADHNTVSLVALVGLASLLAVVSRSPVGA